MINLDALIADYQNEFKICDKCKGVNLTTLILRLQKLDPHALIHKPSCISYCGPGRDYPFVILNNKPIVGTDEDDLIAKIGDILKGSDQR